MPFENEHTFLKFMIAKKEELDWNIKDPKGKSIKYERL